MTNKKILNLFLILSCAIFILECGQSSSVDPTFHPGVSGNVATQTPQVIASNFIATAESTGSTSPVDLTTPDSVTFTLTATTTVAIDYWAEGAEGSSTGNMNNNLYIDGSATSADDSSMSLFGGYAGHSGLRSIQTLPAGSHTVDIKHSINTAIDTWNDRLLMVTPAPTLIAWSAVTTDETTSSSTLTDTATPDSISFTLGSSTPVVLSYVGEQYNICGGATALNGLSIDGTDDNNSLQTSLVLNGFGTMTTIQYVPTLAAGAHTIKAQHATTGCQMHFLKRYLVAYQSTNFALATNFVATTESSSSTSYTDLATPDQTTVTLTAPANVVIQYFANILETGSGGSPGNAVMVDGVLDTTTLNRASVLNGVSSTSMTMTKVSLAAGTHTIKVQHITDAGTAQWSNRQLTAILVP